MLASLPIALRISIWLWVALQIVLVLGAIRVYLLRRTRLSQLLMWACVAYAISSLSWYLFYLVRAALHYRMLSTSHPEVVTWQSYTERASQIVFMVLMLFVFRSLHDERQGAATPKV